MFDKDDALRIANDMAFMACIWIDDGGNEVNDLVKFAQLCFEEGRKQGISQENALWKLAETSRDIGYDK